MFKDHLATIISRTDLNQTQMAEMMSEIFDGKTTDAQVGAMMAALATKGETVEELAGAALGHAQKSPPHPGRRHAGRRHGFDARDSTSLELGAVDFAAACVRPVTNAATESVPLAGLRIGLPASSSARAWRRMCAQRWMPALLRSANSAPRRCRYRCRAPSCRFPPTT